MGTGGPGPGRWRRRAANGHHGPVPRWAAPDGVEIDYQVAGEGPAVLLMHGFASSASVNWVRPGVVDALVRAGFTAVAYDARGHGRSGKPHDPAAYADNALVRDAVGLIDHLALGELAVVGYSMGAQVAAWLVPTEPRVRRAVLGGIGSRLLAPRPQERRYPAEEIARALEAEDPETVEDATPRAFRAFADATKADRLALAALQRSRVITGHPSLESIDVPVLMVVGERDTLVGDAELVARSLPEGRLVVVPGDHLSAVTSPEFATAVVDFLSPP
ncbi:MAG TPA: alpha/beta hydrolase [Acidimicrobiaceae bacterium]|nr:alpha/beta hydrolase [Acidimicrobiaceae bacterium]